MSYTMYTPLNVWLDPASVTDVVAYIQTYLSENTIYSETEIETIIHDYLIAHPELIGGVQSVNGKTGTVVLSASDINTTGTTTIQAVLTSLSSQISDIAQTVTGLDSRVTANATGITNEATARANADTALGNRITALQGAVGSPLVAVTASAMTDTSKIYVYTGSETGYTNGNWYYYNGSTWTSGGVYNATAINTDTTLTVAGMAADAKATGDGLNDLKSALFDATGNKLIAYNYPNAYFNIAGDTVTMAPISSQNVDAAVVNCVAGDVFTISGTGGSGARLYAFIDSSNNILKKAYSGESGTNIVVTAPTNSAQLIINNRKATTPDAISYYGELLAIKMDKLNGIDVEVADIKNAACEWATTDIPLTFQSASGFYDENKAFNTYSGITTASVTVTEGEKYYVISRNYGNIAIAVLFNSNDRVNSVVRIAGGNSPQNVTITIPSGVTKLMLQRYQAYYPTKLGLITGIKAKSTESVLNGKNITLIGDSITEKNFRAKVNWSMFMNEWAGAVIQNLGVGGTGFYNGVGSNENYYAKIASIQSTPDIIGVALSWNDFADPSFPIGTASDTGTASLAGYANDFFTELITAYPTTPIICYVQSPWGAYRPSVTASDTWVSVLKEICNNKGIPFYDEMYYGSALKPWLTANRAVYYVCDDPDDQEHYGQSDDVHPNTEGHKVIARHLYTKFAENLVTTGLNYY